MAHDAIAFLAALEFGQADILGFSIGSFVAQEIALIRPDLVRRLILASSAPRGAAGMHRWAPEVIGAVGRPETNLEGYLEVFFARSLSSQQAGQDVLRRIYARTKDRDKPTTWATPVPLAHAEVFVKVAGDRVPRDQLPAHALLQALDLGLGARETNASVVSRAFRCAGCATWSARNEQPTQARSG